MAQPVKAATARPKDLNPIPRTQVVERKLASTGCPLTTDHGAHMHEHKGERQEGRNRKDWGGREEEGESLLEWFQIALEFRLTCGRSRNFR